MSKLSTTIDNSSAQAQEHLSLIHCSALIIFARNNNKVSLTSAARPRHFIRIINYYNYHYETSVIFVNIFFIRLLSRSWISFYSCVCFLLLIFLINEKTRWCLYERVIYECVSKKYRHFQLYEKSTYRPQ